jgi:hypothetical protein
VPLPYLADLVDVFETRRIQRCFASEQRAWLRKHLQEQAAHAHAAGQQLQVLLHSVRGQHMWLLLMDIKDRTCNKCCCAASAQ